MSWAFGLPALNQPLPDLDPSADTCADCGDLIAWCPIWCHRWPQLENHREEPCDTT
jgi:hypothetical protein